MQPGQEPYMPMQQDVPVSSDELYANYLQEDRIKNLIEQTSPDHQLEEIEWRIKGYRKNTYTKQWEKISKDLPEISPMLVARYISYLSSILNENTRFTNLSSGEINKIMARVIEWLADDIEAHAEDYGLKKDYTEWTRIGQIMLNQTFTVLKRSQNGMESRRIFSSLQVNENISPMAKKKGLLDAMMFWKD